MAVWIVTLSQEAFRVLSISYPEPSLSGSGHTGLKNDPDWSIQKLLNPYPLWRSRARLIWVKMIYFALFGLKICLFWRIFCCFSSEKVVKGLRSWFMHTWIHLGKITAFVMVIIHTFGSLWVSIDGNDGICPWSTILECYYWKQSQAYKTCKRTSMLRLCLYKIWDFLIEL
jgi:hypothetical protein